MNLKCPKCDNKNIHINIKDIINNMIVFKCDDCDEMFTKPLVSETSCCGIVFKQESKTLYDINDWVFINYKEHVFYLRVGCIIDKDHVFYKIRFDDGIVTWIPHHWTNKIDMRA